MAVLVFEFLQPLYVRRLQPRALGRLLVVRRGADSVIPLDLVGGAAGIGLFHNRHNLRLGEF
jgi:hypothetical protein